MKIFLTLFCLFSAFGAQAKSTKDFLKEADETLRHEGESAQRAEWVKSNFITVDTTNIAAETNARYATISTDYAIQSKKYKGSNPDEKRQLYLLLNSLVLPAPSDKKKTEEMTQFAAEMEAMYGSGKYCDKKGKCRNLQEIEDILEKSRNPAELLDVWNGWHTVAVPMKDKYKRVVELANMGAKDMGFANLADVWKAKYDMSSEEFEKTLDKLWTQMQPLYEQLHCYTRAKLNKKYGDKVVSKEGPIPAHLLGNPWAQSWSNIRDVLGVDSSKAVDITKLLKAAKYDSKKMTSTAENFFVSLGMPKLPPTFYERSLFDKPRDREVVCHASAWDIDLKDDVRIKMCIRIDEDSFRTIHHELGHIYYYLAYKNLPVIYQGSAHDGFHEAMGDVMELSITPKYLKEIGLLKTEPKGPVSTDQLMIMALEKVAFQPFGLLIDKWRWDVFSGKVQPEQYNAAWWELRRKYQGVAATGDRPSDAFDPGAKYHIPANTPYSRYFMANVLQFQIHRALCKTAGHQGDLAACSIYGNKAVGEKIWKFLQMGQSKPWPDALEALTGQREMDATGVRDYFAPLEKWLIEKNKGQKCGW